MTDKFFFKGDSLKYIESHIRHIDFAKFKVNTYFNTTKDRGEIITVRGRITSLVGKGHGNIYANVITPDKEIWQTHIDSLDPTSLAQIARHLSELCGD
jgi:hypothetical protein